MTNRMMLIAWVVMLNAAIGTSWADAPQPSEASGDAAKPTVLVLGDSISIGYTPFLREQLADVADVVRPQTAEGQAENCAGTKNGIRKVDQWIAQAGKPDVITFNFGLHDFKRETPGDKPEASNNPKDPPQSDPERYRRNLTRIVKRLEATGAKLFFVTTTPVPPGGVRPHRDLGDSLLYNGIARQVVEPRGIEVIDLYAVAAAEPGWMRPVNVHFTSDGSKGLAAAIAKPVRAALADLQQAKTAQSARAAAPAWQADPQVVERTSRNPEFNYREENVPSYELPRPLADEQGQPVDAKQWPEQRERTLQQFRDHVYGHVPAEAAAATITYTPTAQYDSLHLTASQVEARITAGDAAFTFPLLVYLPKQATGPVPAIVMIQNRAFPDLAGAVERPSPFVPVEAIVKRGYAVAVFHTSHVDPDRQDGFHEGIRGFFARAKHGPQADLSSREPGDWGALSAWAWGASRVLDYLETLPQIDQQRVAVIGHSRGGKTAAWAAANDTRFAAALVNESGCGGAALSRRRFGETVQRITTAFPHWFSLRFNDYVNNEDALPVDQHQLIGLIAPRAVAVASADEDLWADPRGEYLSLVHAAPVYRLLGAESIEQPEMPPLGQPRFVGPTGYFIRPGAHGLHEGDWANYLDFLDKQLRSGAPPTN